MEKFLCFAYGSNMLRERLVARCPSAEFYKKAHLPGHRLTFDKISNDKSGKCAFVETVGVDLPGVLWAMSQGDREKLDKCEGAGRGYKADNVSVMDADGDKREALIYRAVSIQEGLQPYEWYWALVVAGAMQNGLALEHVAELERVQRKPDPDPGRTSCLEALEALRQAKYEKLLR